MKTGVCSICGKEFIKNYSKHKTCSTTCRQKQRRETLGRWPAEVHGFAREGKVERLHSVWRGIIKRCTCKTHSSYKHYGARGICICDSWFNSYVEFRSWAYENGYSEDKTIERIDNNDGYFPENCKWSDRKEQARNRRTTNWITFNGETKSLAEWADILNIKYGTLSTRLRSGKSVEESFTKRVNKSIKHLMPNGEYMTYNEGAAFYNVHPETIRYRVKMLSESEARPHVQLKNA